MSRCHTGNEEGDCERRQNINQLTSSSADEFCTTIFIQKVIKFKLLKN